MANVYSRIASNRNKSLVLFSLFFLFILALGYVFGYVTGLGYFLVAIAFIIAISMALASYYYSDKIVISMSHARPLRKDEFPFLFHAIEGLSIAAGIPQPKAYIIDDTAPNAFATGRNPKNAVICVTTGLLQKMNRTELEGVIAHELSHIKNYDMRLMTMTVVLVGVIVLLSDIMLRSFLWGGDSGNDRGSGKFAVIMIVIGLALAILSPIIATLIKLSISRKREFLADADAALLTRYPEGLASALEKLEKDKEPLEVANKATEHLYIVNPLKNYKGWLNSLFSTHPPIAERVKALRG